MDIWSEVNLNFSMLPGDVLVSVDDEQKFENPATSSCVIRFSCSPEFGCG